MPWVDVDMAAAPHDHAQDLDVLNWMADVGTATASQVYFTAFCMLKFVLQNDPTGDPRVAWCARYLANQTRPRLSSTSFIMKMLSKEDRKLVRAMLQHLSLVPRGPKLDASAKKMRAGALERALDAVYDHYILPDIELLSSSSDVDAADLTRAKINRILTLAKFYDAVSLNPEAWSLKDAVYDVRMLSGSVVGVVPKPYEAFMGPVEAADVDKINAAVTAACRSTTFCDPDSGEVLAFDSFAFDFAAKGPKVVLGLF